jgi:phosphatidylglycerol lysyltransferase
MTVAAPPAARTAAPRPSHPKETRWREVLTWVTAHIRPWLVGVFVVVIALTAWREFRALDFHALRSTLRHLSVAWLIAAASFTVLNIAGMGLYDLVALGAPADDPPPWIRWKIGCLCFTISNLVATGPLAGPALRLWLYREHGVSNQRIAQAIAGALVGLWGGLALWIVALTVVPRGASWLAIPLVAALAVLVGEALGRVRLPPWIEEWTGSGQRWTKLLAIGLVDWFLATAVFLTILAAGNLPLADLGHVALLFLLGHVTGVLTLVPGGLGSADAFWLWSLGTRRTSNALAAAIVAYRLIYYLIPWVVSVTVLATEWTSERLAALKFVRTSAALLTAACGYLVILSAATPSVASRLHFIARWLPTSVLEASHFVSVLVGLALVVLSRGLRRGFREAMLVVTALLLVGAVANLGKGGDWEEALVFVATAFLIARHHRAFGREGRIWPLLDDAAVVNALAVTAFFILVGWWAHRDVPFAADLWLRFTSRAPGARALRGATVLLASSSLFALVAVLRSRLRAASAEEIDRALETILATEESHSTPLMVAAGDKLIWRFEDRGLLLYGTTGNYLVVFSDPVVPPGDERACLESFLNFAEGGGWEVVFYQNSPRWIPHLHDQGFSLFKLGEEAIVDVRSFSLEGKRFKTLRNSLHHVERAGVKLRVMPPAEVGSRIAELRAVSDAWLTTKHVPEKRFSVGFFSEPFLRRFPAIVAEDAGGRILGFASLMPGRSGGEASADLMRHHPDAPDGVMDAIFVHAFAWAREQGYATFSLGMAPLSTVGESRRAPLWERLSRFLYRHGAYFYNFQGLRQYKQKFQPIWEPRYMAYKPPWEWPQAMGAVAALIAGGWHRMVLPAKWVSVFSRSALILLLVASPALGAEAAASAKKAGKPVVLPAGVVQKTVALPAVGRATVYMPADPSRVKRVVLFLSGDGGWELGVVDMALRLAPSAIVAGISLPPYQKANSTGSSCWYPAGELETAAERLEKAVGLGAYFRPTLVGYSSGASLVYAVLAQAPPSSFAGGVSVGFCPSVEISRSICGREGWHPSPRKEDGRPVQKLPPHPQPMAPWKILHGTIDQVCSPSDVASFASQVPSAHLDMIDKVGHGFSVTSRWGAIFDRAVASLPTGAPDDERASTASSAAIAALDLPLRVIPAEGSERATLLFLSGDGGWADLDQSVAAALAKRGLTTIGWSSLRYFWKSRSPAEVVAATERVAHAISGRPLLVGGYSFGADVVGYLAPRFEPFARGIFLIGTEKYATFEVSPLDWVRTSSATTPYSVASSLAKTKLPWLCLESESGLAESGCPEHGSDLQRRSVLPGGHHFGGDYEALGKTAGQWIDEVLKER